MRDGDTSIFKRFSVMAANNCRNPLMLMALSLTGCASLFGGEPSSEPVVAAATTFTPPATENSASQKDIAQLQSKVDSHAQSIAELRSEILRLKQGIRSGLLDPVPAEIPQELQSFKQKELEINHEQPDLGFEDLDRIDPDMLREEFGRLQKEDRPYALLEEAIMNFEKKDYASVLVTLQSLSSKYPGYRDEGLSDVLLAESWSALGSPERALGPLERFMGLHGSSRLLPRAKLAQADAFSKLGERDKATQLLLEVVALAPKEKTAELAKARLMELKDLR